MGYPTTVYTDGACSGNPGPGGWAWAVPDGPFATGAERSTTNQRMELAAALEAVRSLAGPLQVVSDSTYLVNCFRDRWWEGWIARGWVNSQRKPVANRDLWEPLVDEVVERRIGFRWVKGHSGDPWNDLVDRLAVEAAIAQTGRRGDSPPTELGRADEPGPGAGMAGDREIEGHTLLVMGHRPPELGGYGETPTAVAVRHRLAAIMMAKQSMLPDLVVVTGLALGAETLAAEAAASAGVPYVVVLAHPGQDDPWPPESRRRFATLRMGARDVVTLSRHTPATRQRAAASFNRRDAWLRRNADEAVVVWDGAETYVGRTVRSLRQELGEENVWTVDPAAPV
jgi:ribonuclease HI/uncharacterized phage-like protein YoqJ